MNSHCPLCVVIPGPSFAETQQQVARATLQADLLELRLDLFDFDAVKLIAALKNMTPLPVIFTLRRAAHGGQFNGSERDQLHRLRQLLSLQPKYLDLEYAIDPAFFEEVRQNFPHIQIICSVHDWSTPPPDLPTFYATMRQQRAHLYKVVTQARHAIDALQMLTLVREAHQRGESLIGICLGEAGQLTRILAPVFGGAMTFAALDESCCTAPGQLDAHTLLTLYRYRTLNANTHLFGVIGDPVAKSQSPFIHNTRFQQRNLNALYVKIPVPPSELDAFFLHTQLLGFRGFSVTMPLKERVVNYCTNQKQLPYTAINTLSLSSDSILGFNTDGWGALAALKGKLNTSFKGKRIVILGAGGAAMAIADTLHSEGAQLVILNRHVEKAQQLASRYHAYSGSLNQFHEIAQQGYDILINATSVGMGNTTVAPIAVDQLIPGRIVMDIITYPKETLLLNTARDKGCTVVYGEEMLAAQAERQFEIWFGNAEKIGTQ